jgi:hypothetical protein
MTNLFGDELESRPYGTVALLAWIRAATTPAAGAQKDTNLPS